MFHHKIFQLCFSSSKSMILNSFICDFDMKKTLYKPQMFLEMLDNHFTRVHCPVALCRMAGTGRIAAHAWPVWLQRHNRLCGTANENQYLHVTTNKGTPDSTSYNTSSKGKFPFQNKIERIQCQLWDNFDTFYLVPFQLTNSFFLLSKHITDIRSQSIIRTCTVMINDSINIFP